MAVPLQLELDRSGFAVTRNLISADLIEQLRCECDRLQVSTGKSCVRDILQLSPSLRQLANHLASGAALPPIAKLLAVRGILFDKTPEQNWPVPWHQDLSIAIRNHANPAQAPRDPDGYHARTVKDGVPHIQPPVELLERMVTLRLHLDDTPAENGALQLVPRSHLLGRIPTAEIPEIVRRSCSDTCTANPGDALLMKPLILHASARTHPATTNQPPHDITQHKNPHQHRRVLHFEYAPPDALAPELEWHESAN